MIRPPPRSPPFPYTTLFRSPPARGRARRWHGAARVHGARPSRRPVSRSGGGDRKSTRLNSSHVRISYAVFCLKKNKRTPAVGIAPRLAALPPRTTLRDGASQ